MGYCGNCGGFIDESKAYCPECGHLSLYYRNGNFKVLARVSKANLLMRFLAAIFDDMVATFLLGLFTAWGYGFGGILYYLLCDSIGGRSIGRLITGTILVNVKTGRPADFKMALIRNTLGILLMPIFIIDIILILIRRDGRKCADLLAGTQVTTYKTK